MDFWKEFVTVSGAVPVLRAPDFPAKHGFSTRSGGVSTLPHLASLNLGADLGDGEGNAEENRARFFRAALGGDPPRVMTGSQIHSATVLRVTADTLPGQKVDGYVTDQPGIALFIRTADCQPILFCDPEAGVIAASHSGWRGTVASIASETVRQMVLLGASPARIRAAIGPCIHGCCYEVGDEVTEAIRSLLGSDADRALLRGDNGKFHADLCRVSEILLLRAGLDPAHISASDVCTCCHPDRFFSHRASGGKRGLGGAVIML